MFQGLEGSFPLGHEINPRKWYAVLFDIFGPRYRQSHSVQFCWVPAVRGCHPVLVLMKGGIHRDGFTTQ
jgi:hypothetical protein